MRVKRTAGNAFSCLPRRPQVCHDDLLHPSLHARSLVCLALSEFVDINLSKQALRLDLSEEFNDESVITVPKTLKQMFTIVPSKLRFVTLIAFLLRILNDRVSQRDRRRGEMLKLRLIDSIEGNGSENPSLLGHQRSRSFPLRCVESDLEWR